MNTISNCKNQNIHYKSPFPPSPGWNVGEVGFWERNYRNSIIILIIGLLYNCSYTPPSDTKALEDNFKEIITEKVQRIGFYILASKQAENEGYGELAVYFSEIAQEEINHIKAISVLNLKTARTTKKNVKKAMKMEKNASRRNYQSILKSSKLGNDENTKNIFEKIIQDEKRHFLGLRGLIKKKRVK